jgi:4-hydroxy-3-methylbut-2-enyl diphosphate reductase
MKEVQIVEIIRAEYFGTCFGVERALDLTKKTLETKCKVFCLGELIHNNDVISDFKEKGLEIIEDTTQINSGDLILRSHGVGKYVYDYCSINNINIIDATCPKVRNIHKIVSEYCMKKYHIIIFGDKSHPEIIGIEGWCENKVSIYSDLEDFKTNHKKTIEKSCVVFQTTYNINKYTEIKEYFNNIINNDIIIKNTICNATEKRQEACKELAQKCDAVIVIGGKQSSNTKKLYEISKELCEKTFWIENSKEIPYNLIKNSKQLGITAGASTPLWIVEEVIFNVRKESNA